MSNAFPLAIRGLGRRPAGPEVPGSRRRHPVVHAIASWLPYAPHFPAYPYLFMPLGSIWERTRPEMGGGEGELADGFGDLGAGAVVRSDGEEHGVGVAGGVFAATVIDPCARNS